MKKFCLFVLIILMVLCSASCAQRPLNGSGKQITDNMGNTFYIPENPKVIACYGSFAHSWLLSGGTLAGASDDTVKERGLDIGNAEIIGSVKEPNLELIVSLNPDYVILSSELTNHLALKSSFDSMNIAYGYFSVDTFEDYADMMRKFCNVTGREDLYEKHVTDVKSDIEKTLSDISENSGKTFLLMRVFSSGIKVKTDTQAYNMIEDMGLKSITDKNPSLLKDLSAEAIIKENPDYIFAITMGEEGNALSYLRSVTKKSPALKELKAVKNGNFHILPKELFHYKPNNRWNDSYEYLAKILQN